jgi:LacI family transcriptional regulator
MTVNEIAKLANVSIGTVDRVIHSRGRVSPETRGKIQKIIDETGYQPNALARHLKLNCNYKIGVLIPEITAESGYWKQLHDGICRTAENELSAFSFKTELYPFVRPDRLSFAAQFQAMVTSDCCAYIIAPVIQEQTLFLLYESNTNRPYCFIDSALPGLNPLCTVAQDPFRAGYLAGRMTELTSEREGTYAVIKSDTEAYNQNERARGFCEWFARDTKTHKAVLISGGSADKKTICSEIDTLLAGYPSLSGLCMVNASTHIAAAYIQKCGLKDRISVTGFDLVTENCEMLRSGLIDCLISQKPAEQGRQVMMQLYRKLVLEEDCMESIQIPIDVYFKENLIF